MSSPAPDAMATDPPHPAEPATTKPVDTSVQLEATAAAPTTTTTTIPTPPPATVDAIMAATTAACAAAAASAAAEAEAAADAAADAARWDPKAWVESARRILLTYGAPVPPPPQPAAP